MTWKVQIVSLSKGEAVAIGKYSDTDLLSGLFDGEISDQIGNIATMSENVGLDASVRVDVKGIIDDKLFVTEFLDTFVDEEFVEVVNTEPRGRGGQRVPTGHPDFILRGWVEWACPKCGNSMKTGSPPGESRHCRECGDPLPDDVGWSREEVFLELKKGNDSLRRSQLRWIMDNIAEKRVWVMTVEEV